MSKWPRIILHADMDAFYAAVEQLDNPALRGKPLLVGYPGARSVVTTASYEARPFGVGSAMPMSKAQRLCPQAIVVPPRFERYHEISSQIRAVFDNFSPVVEPLSLDEAFLDMTGSEGLFGPPAHMGLKLKAAVFEATKLRVSVGVSSTKYVAKVASDFRKPDGLTVVAPNQIEAFLWPLPIKRLWGVGAKSLPRLEALGLHFIGDVARANPAELKRALGSLGEHIYALAHAQDVREVIPDREAKSCGHEETLDADIEGPEATRPYLLSAADRVAARLRADNIHALGVRVKLKTSGFRIMTRQKTLGTATQSAPPLYQGALELLETFSWDEPLRLVGLTAFDLREANAPAQRELFVDSKQQKQTQLDKALDTIHERFGNTALRRASQSPSQRKPRP